MNKVAAQARTVNTVTVHGSEVNAIQNEASTIIAVIMHGIEVSAREANQHHHRPEREHDQDRRHQVRPQRRE